MIVRFGNTAPIFIKTHDSSCIPECPARHEEVQFDSDGAVVVGKDGTPITQPVHDGTRVRTVVALGEGETYRVTESDVAIHPDTHDMNEWIDRAFTSITSDNGAWKANSDAPPAWVESDWPELERKLASWFDCPIGEPQATEQTSVIVKDGESDKG